MRYAHYKKSIILGAAIAALCAGAAWAETFDIPSGDLKTALDSYARQTGVALMVSDDAIKGVRTKGVAGSLSQDDALLPLPDCRFARRS